MSKKELIKKDNMKEDLIAKGFHKLDDNLITNRPPKIKWGEIYKGFTDKEKITYLEKLASSMNHAAHLIQSERNELGRLCELKEQQIIKLKEAMDKNMLMLQTEMTKINEERQRFNKEVLCLNQRIRELEK
jgi:hypothetical protein